MTTLHRLGLLVVLLPSLLVGGCARHRATAAECRASLDRIVAVELQGLGYRDPVLTRRRQGELAGTLRGDLAACSGVWVRDDLARCLAAADSAASVVHDCLQ